MRRGTTVVEMAVVAPVVVLMMLGFMEVGNAFRVKQSLNHAANRAARAATLPGYSLADVKDVAAEALNNAGLRDYTVTSDIDELGPEDRAVTVEINIPFNRVLFTGSMLGGGGYTLSAKKTAHREMEVDSRPKN